VKGQWQWQASSTIQAAGGASCLWPPTEAARPSAWEGGQEGGRDNLSEHLALRWEDVHWERGRFRVDSPKTGERWVPIFPELRPYLEECFTLAEEGAVHVTTRYRDSNANLRTQFLRIIRRAGERPWPRLFHNLRASRETELAAEYPIHVVCAWIGNTAAIAARHYLTVREEDYARATLAAPSAPPPVSERLNSGANSGALEAQKAAQQLPARTGKEWRKSP
jgi:hypothetical protein